MCVRIGPRYSCLLIFHQVIILHQLVKKAKFTESTVLAECYPNGTISVTNPNVGSFTNVYAVENEGTSGAVECTCSTSGSESIITGCSQVGNTAELQWLKHGWLAYHDCFKLVLESLAKNPIAADIILGII